MDLHRDVVTVVTHLHAVRLHPQLLEDLLLERDVGDHREDFLRRGVVRGGERQIHAPHLAPTGHTESLRLQLPAAAGGP
ncbi:hypothetical protein GCM10009742_00160 [Kribbella karoonensis]|uniref:Uncharacterized protein n=1 Tax=Kribbella karoonensis TaxID=324851 RepID=A0ABN2CRH4_9ACTN